MMTEGQNERELADHFISNFKTGGNVLAKTEKKEKETVAPPDFPVKDMRNGARGVITWAEITNGEVARPSLEILTPARHLADQLGDDTKISTILIGKKVDHLADTLFEHGVDEVILVEDDRLEEYLVLPFSDIIAQILKARHQEIALFAATTAGRELAPRIAVKTGKIIVKPILFSRRPTYGDSKLATILGFVCPQISTARAGTFEVPAVEAGRKGALSTFTPELNEKDFSVEILKTVRGDGGMQALFTADVIVSGGRGATSDNLELVKKLAEALKEQGVKAEWACSRVVVDEGLSEYARQIGQTGKTVRPKVYIAIGISGAIQHIAGIKESGKIVAIDHNPKASIFHHADFGIVGEYEDVVPELIERVKRGFTFGIETKAAVK